MRTYDKLIATISARRSVAPVRRRSGRAVHLVHFTRFTR
jgi:hypothetical protein